MYPKSESNELSYRSGYVIGTLDKQGAKSLKPKTSDQ